ncbi:MAG: hypothetical protein RL543_1502, partial [Pseudomonadota bacterium]
SDQHARFGFYGYGITLSYLDEYYPLPVSAVLSVGV